MTNKAVFLDKDGTLIKNVPYNVNPQQIEFAPDALEALHLLHKEGYQLFVITNQSGVARGYFPESALEQVEQYLRSTLADAGIPLAGFYYCPHHPEGKVAEYAVECICRKPRPGMLFKAGREHNLNLAKSWVIGDILNDIEAGRRAECNTILLDNNNETEWTLTPYRRPHHTVTSLTEAARTILLVDAAGERERRDDHPVPKTRKVRIGASS